MNGFKKNQIIITALVVMIVVASYLNFTDKEALDQEQYVFNSGATKIDALVANEDYIDGNDTVDKAEESLNNQSETVVKTEDNQVETEGEDETLVEETISTTEVDKTVGEAVLVNSTGMMGNYFLEKKIEREQVRAESLDILLEVINNENIGEEQKVVAAEEMIGLQERIEKEALSESLLEAKGFDDVFVRISEGTVDVVVGSGAIESDQMAQITDIVARKTGVDPTAIVITTFE